MTYQGTDVVTEDNLIRYLKECYPASFVGHPVKDARELVTKHRALLDEGIKNNSFAYYVGDLIADEEGWLSPLKEDQ